MKTRIFVISVFFATVLMMQAQDVFSPVLEAIEANSPTLSALRGRADARIAANHAQNAPDDPEVQFGYKWASPSEAGPKKDVGVSQKFDFPTVYIRRNRLSAAQDRADEFEYRYERMNLLLQAKKLCIELAYNNALAELNSNRLLSADSILQSVRRRMQTGDATQLELNRAELETASIISTVDIAEINRRELLSQLAIMNGGMSIEFTVSNIPLTPLPENFDLWLQEAAQISPELEYIRAGVAAADNAASLQAAQGLPKFSVGYNGEFVPGQNMQGITVGLSIPLWSNRGQLRQARAEARAEALELYDAEQQYIGHLRTLHATALRLSATIATYTDVISRAGNTALLLRAYEGGELTLAEYHQELDHYYQVVEQLLATQRNLALTQAELTAYAL